MSASKYLLNVKKSYKGKAWRGLTDKQSRISEQISQLNDYPSQISNVLARLGVDPYKVDDFLSPKLKNLLPDPTHLKDMEKASNRLIDALINQEQIAVFADYDVDGAASAALIISWLKEFGINPTLYVPDRITEGYGLNSKALAELSKNHPLILCVDCGTSSHKTIKNAGEKTDIVVIDHHIGSEELPPAYAIVNPNRQDQSTDFSYLCAAGVVFLFLVATTTILRRQGKKSPDLMQALDLVALATVADVVPLVGLNRAFIKQGLKVIKGRKRKGLKWLSDISKINNPVDEYHLGFVLGPRINAGGRIGKTDLGAKLLSTTSDIEAENLARKLDNLNSRRQEICTRVEEEAISQVEKKNIETPVVFVYHEGWHPGVIGIVASRIKEKTDRPSFVISFSGKIGKGSGRSIPGIDLGSLMQRLLYEGLIEEGGGHAMAAGITLSKAQLVPAFDRLSELINLNSLNTEAKGDYAVDGILMPKATSLELVDMLAEVGPFGSGAPQPHFAFPNQNIIFSKRVGSDHLKIIFGDDNKNKVDAICFKAFSSPLGQGLENNLGKKFHLVGKIVKNTWQGRQKVQVIIEDAIEVQK